METELIHFGSFDDRFCGSKALGRRFTTDPNGVTCPACKDQDTFVISPSGLVVSASPLEEWEK